MMRWKTNSIAFRLTFQVILFSTLVAVFSTAFQLYLDYRRDVQDIYAFFTSIEETNLRPMEASVWILDELQVHLQLEGLINREDIVYAAVEMDGQVAWSRGNPLSSEDSIAKVFSLQHHVRGRNEEIGRLHVTASLEGIRHRLVQRIIVLLASNTVKTFLVSGFILLLFRRNITRHLVRLSQHAATIDLAQRRPELIRLDRSVSSQPDELDQVTAAFNNLCASGYSALHDLAIQRQRLQLFLDATEEVVIGVDTEGRCIFINRSGLQHFTASNADELIGTDILHLLSFGDNGHNASLDSFASQIRVTMAQRRPLFSEETELRLPDGRVLFVALRSYPVLESGRCTGAVVFYADISQRQQLEQEKLLFTKAIRQAPGPILMTDPEGVIQFVNASFERIMECSGTELVGTSVRESLHELGIAEQADQVRALINQGAAWSGTFVRSADDGRHIVLDASIFPIVDRRGQLTNVVAVGRDITREQQLLGQLHHAQKMEAVGKLAASIAHEFGNPLLGIRFALRDVQQRLGQDAEDRQLLHLAEKECDRMRKLIRDLQQFNRPSTGKKTVFDLHQILNEVVALHQPILKRKNIAPVKQYVSGELLVCGVEDQVRQVFINLFLNTADAMSDKGGRFILRTRRKEGWVMVGVEDNGTGIAPEIMAHIFEPFFTTKAAVEGSGLGLPVSYGIVTAHGGRIEVRSIPGRTEFEVIFPAAAEGPSEGAAQVSASRGDETVDVPI